MNYNLEKNNNKSKKLIIGVSILFCTVILIIGGSIAFFTQSGSDITGNIVTTNISNTLEYNDEFEENTKYNRQGLIPSSIENVLKAYSREDTENKCLDNYGYSACSVYRFSVKNIADVTQELVISLSPTANSYTNLKVIMFEITDEGNKQVTARTNLIKGNNDLIKLLENFSLIQNEERTYEVVTYIEAKDYDQTSEDSGKTFGAGIRIDSVTAGTYVAKKYGTTCWNTEEITSGEDKGTYKLKTFNGIKEDGSIDESCSAYVEIDEVIDNQNYYSINIPSTVGGQEISTLGNMLFAAATIDGTGNVLLNNYHRINKININEGIKVIEDFSELDVNAGIFGGTFMGIGADFSTQKAVPNRTLDLILPDTLKHIGTAAFLANPIVELNIPSNVEVIETYAFGENSNLTSIKFLKDKNNKSNLKTIGDQTFEHTILTTLEIPESYNLITIGSMAFFNSMLTELTISSSVLSIDGAAFSDNKNLKKVYFVDTIENPSQLKIIGGYAFGGCNLTYLTEDDPLIIPSSVNKIEQGAFWLNSDPENFSNINLEFIKYKGSNKDILNNSNYWYIKGGTILLNSLGEVVE